MSWVSDVRRLVTYELPDPFTINDVFRHSETFAKLYPNDGNVEAMLRQALLSLQAQGLIEAVGEGRFRRRL